MHFILFINFCSSRLIHLITLTDLSRLVKVKVRMNEVLFHLFHFLFLHPPERQIFCVAVPSLGGLVSHHGSSVTHTWRGQGWIWGSGGAGWRSSWSRGPSKGSHTHIHTYTLTYRGAIVRVRVRPNAVMGPGVDVADRLTDRSVALTICYLGGSRSLSLTPSSSWCIRLFISMSFFHSVIDSSSSCSPTDQLLSLIAQEYLFPLCGNHIQK